MVISCPMGNVKITIDGVNFDYVAEPLPKRTKWFEVDGRYRVRVPVPVSEDRSKINCFLDFPESKDITGGADSGQDLALVSFDMEDTKVSIGTIGDLFQFRYDYMANGISVSIPTSYGKDHVYFAIAWLKMIDKERQDIYTWFAADPSYFGYEEISHTTEIQG